MGLVVLVLYQGCIPLLRFYKMADRVGNVPAHFFDLNLRNLYAKSIHGRVAHERKVADQL
jgi:hypothetical protein